MTDFRNAFDPNRRPRSWLRIHGSVLIFFVLGAIGFTLVWIELPAIFGAAGRAWVVSDQLEPADAAAVLGGGTDTRPPAAAQLYKAGRVRQILVSNSDTGGAGRNNPDREELLLKLGIPAAAITEFGNDPTNTYEEARALAHWAKQNQRSGSSSRRRFFLAAGFNGS